MLNALRDQGLYQTEYLLRKKLIETDSSPLNDLANARQMAASLRLSGRWLAAFAMYMQFLLHPDVAVKNLRHEQLWCFAEAGIFAQSTCASLLRVPGWHWLFFLPIALLRLMTALALWRLGVRDGNHPLEITDPHLREAVIRLSSFLCEPQGHIVDFMENRYFRDRPVLGFHDERGEGFLETDSLLGVVNQSRNAAMMSLYQLNWKALTPSHSEHNREIYDALTEWELGNSLRIAKAIGDRMGIIKAAEWLARIDRWRGYMRMSRGWTALAGKLKQERCRADKKAMLELLRAEQSF